MTTNRRRLFAATANPDKLREIRQLLKGSGWELLEPDCLPPRRATDETGGTLLENALLKARAGYRRSGLISLADDTGLEVDALGGLPGVRSARFAGQNATYRDNLRLLLEQLEGVPPGARTARFRCIMALVGPGFERWWEGIAEGRILEEPRGDRGFGYDPVFWSPELQKTFAEASPAEKNRVSHRGRALKKLTRMLDDVEPKTDCL